MALSSFNGFVALGGSQLALEIPESLFDYETPWQISLVLAVLAYGAGYTLLNNKMKKEDSSKNEAFTKTLITLKRKIDSLHTEEFNLLVENKEQIKRENDNSKVLDMPKALDVANLLLDINATSILNEFEKTEEHYMPRRYSDDSIEKESTIKKL